MKRIMVLLFLYMVIFNFTTCFIVSAQTETTTAPGSNEYVEIVKKASSRDYPSITYGDAFEKFFTKPEWQYTKESDGLKVVKFRGIFDNNGSYAVASLFFNVDTQNNTCEVSQLNINAVQQPSEVKKRLLNWVFTGLKSEMVEVYPTTAQTIQPTRSQKAATQKTTEVNPNKAPTDENNSDTPVISFASPWFIISTLILAVIIFSSIYKKFVILYDGCSALGYMFMGCLVVSSVIVQLVASAVIGSVSAAGRFLSSYWGWILGAVILLIIIGAHMSNTKKDEDNMPKSQ